METNAARLFVYSVAQAFDGATENNTITLEPGELARGNFLHWAWQIKFVAAQNVAHARRQDAARLRRLGLQARHGARALPPRREGRLGDGPDERGAAPVRRQGRAARVRVARLLEPELQPPRRRERGQEARRRPRSASSPSSSSPRPPRRRPRSRRRRSRSASSPRRPRLLVPGLVPRDPGRETYRVRPGGTTTVSLRPDDRLTIRDLHGGQRAEVAGLAGPDAVVELFGPDVAAGRRGDVPRRPRRRRPRRGARRACRSSRAASPPPTSSSRSRGRRPSRGDGEAVLPDPLADPRLDFQVDRASALAYEVKAGEYIQVIDVRGRQCSDFLAFSAPKLQEGKERGLDATATRSLMGNAYPRARASTRSSSTTTSSRSSRSCATRSAATTPSASPARRSTTRTWATSGTSTARTTSTRELEPYTIEPRKGWPAINFFFNTALRRAQPVPRRRAVVAAGRLRPPARHDRPRLPLERVPRRHRPGQRLEPDRGARARLSRQGALQRCDRAPRHAGRGAEADEGDRASTRRPPR